MNERDIIKVLELVKYDKLQNLQWKVEYLRNEVDMLESPKWKSTNQILKLNRTIHELQSYLPQNAVGMAYVNQESGWDNNTSNMYPIPYSETNTNSYSLQLSYCDAFLDYALL